MIKDFGFIIPQNCQFGMGALKKLPDFLKAAGSTDPAEVLKALPNVSYTGVTGTITFGENGDANRTSAFIKKCNTETATWELVREQGVE